MTTTGGGIKSADMDSKLVLFAALMLFTGSINTIATKYQDETVVAYTKHGRPLTFKHPAVQSACMFAGEFCCLIIYVIIHFTTKQAPPTEGEPLVMEDRQSRHTWKAAASFFLPACCDCVATTLLNLGLYYTFASTFQMLRGTLVLFAGLLTIVLLKRRLHSHHWFGMVLITAGAALVGASSVMSDRQPQHEKTLSGTRSLLMLQSGAVGSQPGAEVKGPLLGDMLVLLAQLFAATQFIVEEKFLKGYRVPALLAVGLEGFWGLCICAIALPALTYYQGPDGQPFDDAMGAWREIAASPSLQFSVTLSIVSIAFFNYFGITVTKKLSGAARATIDACRTLFVWMFSLLVHWERFHALQVLGFIVLISGTSVYNELLKSFLPSGAERRRRLALQEPLLHEEALTWAHQSPSAAVPVPGWGRPPLPPSAPRSARPRPAASSYTMARSMRIAPGAFSPHSMASTAFGGTMANDSVADLQALPEADGVDIGSSALSPPAASPQMPSPFRTPAMHRTAASPTPQPCPPPDAK